MYNDNNINVYHIFIYLYIICADHPISYNIIAFRKQKRIFVHFMNTKHRCLIQCIVYLMETKFDDLIER